jgi:hypothetical protein
MADATYKVAVSRMALDGKIPPGDPIWSTFNASFENREVGPLDLAEAVLLGHPFTTWHANQWRNRDNYMAGQYLALDFDTEDERSTLKTLTADKFIAKYGALLYTSPSHRPEAPRARAVFLIDTPIMQAKNYTLAAAALLWIYGTADRQCKDCCRFWYGSKGCDLELPAHVLPLDTVKHIIAQYQVSGERERKQQAHPSQYHPTADQEEVASALRSIRPWNLDYDVWVQVLMALHREYGDGGLALAEDWADGKPGEVKRKWTSFKPKGNDTGAVTIATVFDLAIKAGWQRHAS